MFDDHIDAVLRELKAIRRGVGVPDRDVDVTNQYGIQRPIDPRLYRIVETADIGGGNSDGSMTLSAGESKSIVNFDVSQGEKIRVHAVGATDASYVKYALVVDDEVQVGGWTESPLGTVNSPFSYNEILGGYVEAEHSVQYVAWYDAPSGSADVDLVGRIHAEVVSE